MSLHPNCIMNAHNTTKWQRPNLITGTGFEQAFLQTRYSNDLWTHAAAAKLLQLCPTLCDPIDSSPPGSALLQARTLEWVAISFSNAWKWKVKVKSLSHARLFVTPWAAAYQAPPSMGFSRQEYWSGLPLPSLLMAWSSGNSRTGRKCQ